MQRGEELDREERVGARLLRDDRREGRGLARTRAERVRDQQGEILRGERADRDAGEPGARVARRLQGRDERVRGRHLVVAVGADDEEEAQVGVGHQIMDEREAGGIGPLKVVEEEREGAFLAGERRDEPPEYRAEAALRVGRRQLRHGRLGAEEERERRDHVHDELRVAPERALEARSPVRAPFLVLREHVEDELPERLDDRGVRDLALVRVELAPHEQPAAADDRLLQLMDERRLADPRVPRHQHELGRPGLGDALEGAQQRRELRVAAVQLLRDLQPIRRVALPQRERLDPPTGSPLREAALEVMSQAARGLVAIFGHLGEELHDDARDGLGDAGDDVRGRGGRARDMAVDPLEGIARLEREPAGQQLVERDAERIQVGPAVDGTVHPARLLRRHVRQRALDRLGRP